MAGYYGGFLDTAVMRTSELFQVLPTFILAAVIVALSGPGLVQVVGVISVLAWPQTARLIRGEVLRVKEMEYVYAVRCLCYSESVILAREVIPNAITPTLALGTLIVGQAMLLEAGLSFLGLSNPDVMSWGRMLNSGQRFLSNAWWLSFFPGCAILVTVPSSKPILVEPTPRLVLKSRENAAGLGASLAIRPKLRVWPSHLIAPSSADSLALATSV